MKDRKKFYILAEVVLGVLVVWMAAVMLLGDGSGEPGRFSVIIMNSDDKQWAAFRYGLEMAAADQEVDLAVLTTGDGMTAEEQETLIRQELENGADGLIVQPIPGSETEEMLRETARSTPVMLVETSVSPENAEALPVTGPDNRAMGETLAEELLYDCRGNQIAGKGLGIFSGKEKTQAILEREEGFREKMKGTGARVSWSAERSLDDLSRVDFLIALDEEGLRMAGEYARANNLHGAIVYGIGYSTEAMYYLDIGEVECLVVPDQFYVGYQSLSVLAEEAGRFSPDPRSQTVDYTVVRRETLFTKENQEMLFTMSQ